MNQVIRTKELKENNIRGCIKSHSATHASLLEAIPYDLGGDMWD